MARSPSSRRPEVPRCVPVGPNVDRVRGSGDSHRSAAKLALLTGDKLRPAQGPAAAEKTRVRQQLPAKHSFASPTLLHSRMLSHPEVPRSDLSWRDCSKFASAVGSSNPRERLPWRLAEADRWRYVTLLFGRAC